MALVSIKDMLNKARKEKYCVGAFDASTLEMAQKIIEAAEEKKSPVIIMGLTPDLQGDMLDYWITCLRRMAERASVPSFGPCNRHGFSEKMCGLWIYISYV